MEKNTNKTTIEQRRRENVLYKEIYEVVKPIVQSFMWWRKEKQDVITEITHYCFMKKTSGKDISVVTVNYCEALLKDMEYVDRKLDSKAELINQILMCDDGLL